MSEAEVREDLTSGRSRQQFKVTKHGTNDERQRFEATGGRVEIKSDVTCQQWMSDDARTATTHILMDTTHI